MLFIAISSTSLFADRATANSNARAVSQLLENRGYIIKNIGGKHLARKGYRTLTRYLHSGNCYAIVSIGDDGVRDLDLKVWAAPYSNNNWIYIGQDASADRVAMVKYCPNYSGIYKFRTKMYSGSGYFRMVLAWK